LEILSREVGLLIPDVSNEGIVFIYKGREVKHLSVLEEKDCLDTTFAIVICYFYPLILEISKIFVAFIIYI